MKKYLLFILLVVSVQCFGQPEPKDRYSAGIFLDNFGNDTLYTDYPTDTGYYKTDTVKCIFLISKITLKGSDKWKYYETGPIRCTIGYDVLEGTWMCCKVDALNAAFYWSYEHISYLDADKKELPKSIIVWQVKEIE